MAQLLKYFPFTASVNAKDTKSLIVSLVIYIVAAAVVGFVLGLLSAIPLIGFIFKVIGWVVDIYCTFGIVLTVLRYFDIGQN
ncbi:MAG: hypothetical protein IJ315_04880 [Firmicutes bacterium]|nr:hypothetical protein [Bacillota bacterium]